MIDPFRQKYFTRAPFSRIDDNETCFICSKFGQPRWLSLFRSTVFKLFKQWNSEQFKFTLKWIAAKSIECSNYKQGRTFSFIKQLLNKIIQFLPCHVLVLSFGRILNHTEHFIEERCSYYSLSMDTCLQDGRCNLLGPSRWGVNVKIRNLALLKNKLKRNMGKT